MFCSKCGSRIGDGDIFCTGCGARVIKEEPKPIQPEATEAVQAFNYFTPEETPVTANVPTESPSETTAEPTAEESAEAPEEAREQPISYSSVNGGEANPIGAAPQPIYQPIGEKREKQYFGKGALIFCIVVITVLSVACGILSGLLISKNIFRNGSLSEKATISAELFGGDDGTA